MPELPEVETTRRGIAPHLEGRRVTEVRAHNRRLRWPVPRAIGTPLVGQRLRGIRRRAKYLLLEFERGTLILHLGMSGSLRILDCDSPRGPHDHLELCFEGNRMLRLTDPRRFGAALWTTGEPSRHRLLASLGPEPLGPDFDGEHLYRKARGRRTAIKNLIMDSHVVVGVGNIYASEALFLAGIHPARAAGRISRERLQRLAEAIRTVLGRAIEAGGTTLQDFTRADGQPGYFAQELNVYGRENAPCPACATPIRRIVLGQRSTWYCPACQR
ncbi:MAG: bifunctional DNA-formamidopyrimidine glycosylase/DNA-(apurinic or apyrimidinic site) lyase [Gammaproteobacteria bacterium]|nr:MAG: bifunctional DNA-formamidopyrimidine glycosylase/DNA-(apurinic or apyrimidinic site) lyase [Gammaproteobacteria bacterium]